MRHLIIPDVHEQYSKLLDLEPKIMEADKVVLLGDFGDTFKDPGRWLQHTYRWVKERLDDPKFTVLIGNHDNHYYFPNPAFYCSGFKSTSRNAVREIITPDDVRKMHLWTEVGAYTLAHAGFHIDTLHLKRPEMEKEAIELGLSGKRVHELFQPGRARGGYAQTGGVNWLDWNYEFEPITGMPQIVGHTNGARIKSEEGEDGMTSWCIDTGLRHIAWIDDETNEVVIEELK